MRTKKLVPNSFSTHRLNAYHFKRELGARIHYVPPTRSSQVAIVILLFLLEYIFFTLSSEMTKGNQSIQTHTLVPTRLKRVWNEVGTRS